MFEPTKLEPWQIRLAEKTISANAFFLIAQDRLMRRQSLSVVRMADGELSLWKESYEYCHSDDPKLDPIVQTHTEKWRKNLGVEGITCREMWRRLHSAAISCDYFAPSISGLVNSDFDLYGCFPPREKYVDIFFINAWTEEMFTHLYKEAKHVLIIHRNPDTVKAFTWRAKEYLGVKVSWIKQEKWEDVTETIEQAAECDAPLVMASLGPAGKFAIPKIAVGGKWPKVCLDVGNSVDSVILFETWFEDQKKKNLVSA